MSRDVIVYLDGSDDAIDVAFEAIITAYANAEYEEANIIVKGSSTEQCEVLMDLLNQLVASQQTVD